MIHEPNIILIDHRCDECGRFWFSENGGYDCPHCAHRKRIELINHIKHLERVNRALRGVLKRKAKR